MSTQTLLQIGELAAATGTTISALRHYDDLGVITPVERVGGKRRFSAATIGRVNFVRGAQKFGFSLLEIRDILDDQSGRSRQLVEEKIAALRAQQVELATMISMLEEMKLCGCAVVAECPSLNDLGVDP